MSSRNPSATNSTTSLSLPRRPDSLRIAPASRPGTIYSNDGDSVDGTSERHALMAKYLYTRARSNNWFEAEQSEARNRESAVVLASQLGVLLRVNRGSYATQPTQIYPDLLEAVKKLNVEVAFTMSTHVTDLIFQGLAPEQTELFFPRDSSQYQIVESVSEIANAPAGRVKKYQYSCLIRQERLVLIWGNTVDEIIERGFNVEKKLLDQIWAKPTITSPTGTINETRASYFTTPTKDLTANTSVEEVNETTNEKQPDVENQEGGESLGRPLMLTSSIFIGLSVCLIMILLFGLGLRSLVSESLIDGNYMRFALVVALPFFGFFGLFFSIVIFGNLFQVFGPVQNTQKNSRGYSYLAPDLGKAYAMGFSAPHITIEMPVYKESLEGVIEPTIRSLREAISHYELAGGSASIFVNDDGMQLLSPEEAKIRQNYYEDNNIGWVSRPPHGKDGYVRAGKFKKASNMNHALDVSNRTEDVLLRLIEEKKQHDGVLEISDVEEEQLYKQALAEVIESDEGRTWAEGNIRIGEHILIIDSDTRVPEDCLVNGAAEFFLSPEVAIIQHNSGVMQVVGDFFENGITFFTNLIYTSIRFSCGSGEVAPFVGHNAFLRWQAVQSVAFTGEDGKQRFWSESHVSEDFDIALRLQITGNVIRLACYHGDGFKEGVSLTIFDELNRWTKYAYGCNELVFNPIYSWLWRGPFTKLFLKFVFSNMQLSSKISITGYITTYYAMAFGLPLTIANYLLIGWYNAYLDKFYIDSWKILVGLMVVFSGMGNVCLAILRYRTGEQGLMSALLTNFRWLPMFTIFFGGLSFHLSLAILSHMFSINMSWGATAKELERSNFFLEVPKIARTFKYMYLVCFTVVGGMIYLGVAAPDGWQITEAVAIVPLSITVCSHIALPLVLNPQLMVFNY